MKPFNEYISESKEVITEATKPVSVANMKILGKIGNHTLAALLPPELSKLKIKRVVGQKVIGDEKIQVEIEFQNNKFETIYIKPTMAVVE